MLRRSFLALMGAAVAAPLVSPLEAFVPGPVPVLAVETTVPYWLLELQAFERLMAEARSPDGYRRMRLERRAGEAWTPTFPTHPLVSETSR